MLAGIVQSSGSRNATLILAATSAVVFFVVLFTLRDRPEDIGLKPLGWQPSGESNGRNRSFCRRLSSRNRTNRLGSYRASFWVVGAICFLSGFAFLFFRFPFRTATGSERAPLVQIPAEAIPQQPKQSPV